MGLRGEYGGLALVREFLILVCVVGWGLGGGGGGGGLTWPSLKLKDKHVPRHC